MFPIYETQFSPGTQGIRTGDVEIEKLGEVDGRVIVTCPKEIASPEWIRRWDLETERKAHYERLGAELAAEMADADRARADQIAAEEAARAEAQRQAEQQQQEIPEPENEIPASPAPEAPTSPRRGRNR